MERKIYRYIKVDGKEIADQKESAIPLPLKDGWEEVPETFNGSVGDKWPGDFDPQTKRKLTKKELAAQGKIPASKGVWYNKETRESRTIDVDGVHINQNKWTREAPLPGEQYQRFDEEAGHFVVETAKKERAEKEAELSAMETEAAECERKRMRSTLATLDGEANAKDARYNLKYKTRIIELRSGIANLKAELGIEDTDEELGEELESA
jgi:hypothetical protein